jgi:uncharacterized membrane protein
VKLRHPVVHGHPLHAMSSDLPIGILPLALAASVAARVRRSRETSSAAGAAAGALALSFAPAVLLGWWDWLTIPASHEARPPATTHGLVNSTAASLAMLAVIGPRRLELQLATLAALLVGAWLGGDLVFRLGWRVRKAELLEQLEEGRSPSDAERVIREHERNDTFLAPA